MDKLEGYLKITLTEEIEIELSFGSYDEDGNYKEEYDDEFIFQKDVELNINILEEYDDSYFVTIEMKGHDYVGQGTLMKKYIKSINN